jgi:hypothetical protein
MDDYARLCASWRTQCAGMIMYAFGFIDWPPIEEEFSPEVFRRMPSRKGSPASQFPELRPVGETEVKQGLMEFWHWRIRTRELIDSGEVLKPDAALKRAGLNNFDDIIRFSAKKAFETGTLTELMDDDFVFSGKPVRSLSKDEFSRASSIIIERHYALNWLCGMAPGNRWDDTPTDT